MSQRGRRLVPAVMVGLVAAAAAAPAATAREWSSPVEIPADPNDRPPSDALRLQDGSAVVATSHAGLGQAFVVTGGLGGPFAGRQLGSGFNIGMSLLPAGPDGLMIRGEWYRSEADQAYKAKLLVSPARTAQTAEVLTADMSSHDDIGDAFDAALAPDGRVVVVWRDTGRVLWLAERAPGHATFGTPRQLTAGQAPAPSVAAGPGGALLISSGDRVVVRPSADGTLVDAALPGRPYPFFTPVVAVDHRGRGVIGYKADDTEIVGARPVDLTTGAIGADQLPSGSIYRRLDLVADGGGRVLATLTENGTVRLLTRADGASTFTETATLSSPGWDPSGIGLALDYHSGEGFIALTESSDNRYVLRVADRRADGTVGPMEELSGAVGSTPVAAFHAGRGLIAWVSRDADRSIGRVAFTGNGDTTASPGDGGTRPGTGDSSPGSGTESPGGPDATPAQSGGSGAGQAEDTGASQGRATGAGPGPSTPSPSLTPRPSPAATHASVTAQAAATVAVLRKTSVGVLATKGYRHPFTADQAGTVTEQVLLPASRSRGRARASARKPLVLAAGSARFAAAGTAVVDVKPARDARRHLRGKRRVRVTVRTVFAPKGGGAPVVASRVVSLQNRGS